MEHLESYLEEHAIPWNKYNEDWRSRILNNESGGKSKGTSDAFPVWEGVEGTLSGGSCSCLRGAFGKNVKGHPFPLPELIGGKFVWPDLTSFTQAGGRPYKSASFRLPF